MIEQLTEIMVRSGAEWVLWLLFALSVASLAIALDRLWAFRGAGGDVASLVPGLRRHLRAGHLDQAQGLLDASDSVAGRVVAAGLCESDLGPAAAEEAMAAAIGLERRELEKRLLFLGTVGNNAPFIGLLGTVIGVVGAFDALGRPQVMSDAIAAAGNLAPERVMGTIAEALVATAVGLLVAIPAVAVYNHFQRRVGAVVSDAETLGHVLLAHLSGARDAPAGRVRREVRSAVPSREAGVEMLSHPVADGAE